MKRTEGRTLRVDEGRGTKDEGRGTRDEGRKKTVYNARMSLRGTLHSFKNK
jgi:hypothetical protein